MDCLHFHLLMNILCMFIYYLCACVLFVIPASLHGFFFINGFMPVVTYSLFYISSMLLSDCILPMLVECLKQYGDYTDSMQ